MLIGDKTILEEIDFENVEQLRCWRNEMDLRKYFREWKDITRDKQLQWYKDRGNNSNQQHVYFQIMAKNVALDNDGIKNRYLVGCCNLSYIDWRLKSAEFGIFLGKEFRNLGLGKEALKMMCDFGFKEMGLHKIWCEVFEGNTSIDLYRRLGFKDEGVLRDNWFHEGKYGNSYVLSVLENEWK